ncbi:hypothetical protein BDQ17DRAFT_1420737 [Cyathus striatus]|nr:hypothetical protein BDQ17DRAFT_1420737 [Cyathus striatus]
MSSPTSNPSSSAAVPSSATTIRRRRRQPKVVDAETQKDRETMNRMVGKMDFRVQPTEVISKRPSQTVGKGKRKAVEVPLPAAKRARMEPANSVGSSAVLEVVPEFLVDPQPVPLSMAPATPSPGAFSASFNDATGPIAGSLSFPGELDLPSSSTAATPEAILDTPSLEEPVLANSKTGEELLEMADRIWQEYLAINSGVLDTMSGPSSLSLDQQGMVAQTAYVEQSGEYTNGGTVPSHEDVSHSQPPYQAPAVQPMRGMFH